MRKYLFHASLLVALIVAASGPARATSKETIQMMQQLDTLQQEVQKIQQTLDTQTAVLKTLIEQATDSVNSMKSQMADLRKATEQNLAAAGAKFDAMTGQIQELSASLDEAKARIGKLNDQTTMTQSILQTLHGPAPAVGGGADAGGAPAGGQKAPVPDPDTLYQSALSYFTGGQYQLAIDSFQQYLQNFSDTDRASNAQFYIGDSYYNQKQYDQAIEEYNKCIERYPDGNKAAAAQLKKGYALLASGDKDAGIKELRSLIRHYPGSPESNLARQRLSKMGVSATTPAAHKRSE